MEKPALNEDLVKLTQEFKDSLGRIKNEFDTFDKNNPGKDVQIAFLERRKEDVFRQLDFWLAKLWEAIQHFDKKTYKLHQEYCH